MTVEIKPTPDSIKLSVPARGSRIRLSPTSLGIIPQGFDAEVIIGGVKYEIHDYRERPGHTAGARIEGDEVVVDLDAQSPLNAINKTIFRWVPSQARNK